METDVIYSCTEEHLHQKCQIQDYQNKDRLSVYRILLLQRTPKLGRTKLRLGHMWHMLPAGLGLNIATLEGKYWFC